MTAPKDTYSPELQRFAKLPPPRSFEEQYGFWSGVKMTLGGIFVLLSPLIVLAAFVLILWDLFD